MDKNKKKVIKFNKQFTMPLMLVVVFVGAAILTNGSLVRPQNISNLVLQNAYVIVMACGMLLCILTGGNVDLSVGSTLCLSAACVSQLLLGGLSVPVAILISLGVGIAIGAIQGYLVGFTRVPPFICTLAGMFVIRGVARVVLDSKTVNITNEDFFNVFGSYIQIPGLDHDGFYLSALLFGIILAVAICLLITVSRIKKKRRGGDTSDFMSYIIKIVLILAVIISYSYMLSQYKGIPVMLLWILGVVVLFMFICSQTVFGRHFYAVGGNALAAKLSGIDSRKVLFWAYLIMSTLAAFSGLLVATRIGSVDGNMGNAYEMDAIAACFIGGASAYGGSGTIQGVVVGALFLGVINMAMSILGLPDQWQYVVKGAVLLAAVIFDVVSSKKAAKV